MIIDYAKLGKRIKHARERKRMTQEALANEIDVNPSYISHIESGDKKLSLKTLFKISYILDTSMDELFQDSKDLPLNNPYPTINALLDECSEDDLYIVEGLIHILINSKINR